MLVDAKGKVIRLGDYVAFVIPNARSGGRLGFGTVIKILSKSVRVGRKGSTTGVLIMKTASKLLIIKRPEEI